MSSNKTIKGPVALQSVVEDQHTSPSPLFDSREQGNPAHSHLWALGVAVALIILVALLDVFMIERTFTLKSAPVFSPEYLFRMLLLAAAALLTAAAALRWPATPVTTPLAATTRSTISSIIIAALLTIAFVSYFLFDPRAFSLFGSEEDTLELLTQALIFFSCGIFVLRAILLRAAKATRSYIWLAAFFAATFFLIGMEEISWFQRVMGIEEVTSGIFAGNAQKESNLHNFFTHESELLYYTGGFVFLILLPFLHEKMGIFKRWPAIAAVMPSRAVVLIAAPLAFFNYAEWNQLFEQFAALMTVVIMGVYARDFARAGETAKAWLTGAFAALLIAAQTAFILNGHLLVRMWQTSEYKEFFIVFGFTVYAIEMLRRRTHKAVAPPPSPVLK